MSLSGIGSRIVVFAPAAVMGAASAAAPQSGDKQNSDRKTAARCVKGEANFLAIDLANEIVTGKRGADHAQKFSADSVAQMMRDGKPTDDMQGFRFMALSGNQGDPDKPAGPLATIGR
jgi:hypothetical protein